MKESQAVETPVARACSCKVGRNVRKYGLGEFDAELCERRADGASLRDLERVVNRALLRGALRAASADVVGDVDAIYDALAGEDASAGEQTEVHARLARAGVDVEALLGDFVSYQTVRTHLKDCLGVDTDRTEPLSVEDARGTIEWARARSQGIVERTLERLVRSEELAAGDLDVTQLVSVTCADCGATVSVEQFVDRGCDCASTSEASPTRSE